MLSYWRNNRDRIREQKVMWLEGNDLPPKIKDLNDRYGAILPQVVVCGTLTRRYIYIFSSQLKYFFDLFKHIFYLLVLWNVHG